MATAPNNPTPPNKKDFDDANASLRMTEQILSSVEQKFQRLLLLQKAIELKIVDPKDVQNFERFLKELSKVDITNLSELKKIGGYLGDSAKRMGDLVDYSSHLNKKSESYSKNLIQQREEYAQIALNSERLVKSQVKSNTQSKLAVSSIDEFKEGFKEALEQYDVTVDIQGKVLEGLDKIRKGQVSNVGLADSFSSAYTDLASSLGDSIAGMGTFRPNISPVVEFDFLEGGKEYIQESMDSILKSVGSPTFEIGGMELPKDMREDVFNTLGELYNGAGSMSSQVLKGTIDALAADISKSFGMATDIASGLIEDLINDQAALSEGLASILSPERQNEVKDFYEQIQKSGDDAQKSVLAYTISAKANINTMNADVDVMAKKIQAMPRLDVIFENLNSASDDIISSLQYTTENLMPRWLSSALGINDAFAKIKEQASQSVRDLVMDLSNGGNKMEALSKFTSSFSSGLISSLGPLALIVISVTSLWNMMTSAGESAKELSKEFGVSRSTAVDMYKSILGMTSAIENTSLKQEDVLEVLKKHRDEYGLIMDMNNKANQEAIKFSAELGKQYGIGAGEAYAFTDQLQQLGADAAASQEIAAVAAYASDLAGIPFSTITKDLAESSEFVATQFAGMPQKAVATAAKLRAMGTSLKSVEKSMEKAFDAKNFLQGMTELNIMTRGVVDLSAMFQKSMAGDVAGAAAEVNKQFDKMVASGQMNQFQMRQFAQVTGQSVEELQKGNKIRKQQAELGKDNVELLSKYLDKLSDADVADAKSAMKAAKRLGAAEKLDTIWASIKDTLVDALMPALEGISNLITFLAPGLKLFAAVIKGIAAPFKVAYDLISSIFNLIKGDTKSAGDSIASVGETIKSTFFDVSSVLGLLGSGVAAFAAIWSGKKLIGGIGKVFNMFEGTKKTTTDVLKNSKSLGTRFKDMFTGAKEGKTFFEKVKGGVKGLFGKTPETTAPEVPGGKGEEKSLLDKGIDKVKEMLGMGTDEAAADPLQTPADALKEAADELKAAAEALSQSGSSGFDRGGRSRSRRGRGGRGRTGGRTGRTGRTQGPAKPRSGRAPKVKTPEIKTPATATTSKVGGMFDKMKTGGKNLLSKGKDMLKPSNLMDTGKNLLSKGKDMIKPANLMKGLKSFNPAGLLTAAAGMGVDYLGSKYEEEAMKTGDQSAMNKSRALKAGGKALEYGGIGATLGSIVPGIGTAVGGAVGGVIGGAVGIWENYFSDDAKKQDEQLKQIREGNKIANGLNNLTEAEIQQLKESGYSDDVIKKLSEGNVSLEGAIKEQFSDISLSDDQLKVLANPKTTSQERDKIMESAFNVPAPTLAVGTNLVKSDGLAMLHQGEAVVPAKVVDGGFKLSPDEIAAPETITRPAQQKVAPVTNEMTDLGTPANAASATTDYSAPPMQSKSTGNQDALLKQLMTIMQDVANRPVQVQIAGVELKALNSKMKVLNNKA